MNLCFFSGKTCLLKDTELDVIGERAIAMCEHLKVILKVQLTWILYQFMLRILCVLNNFSGISCIQFDNTRIVSGSWDKTIKVILNVCSILCVVISGIFVH